MSVTTAKTTKEETKAPLFVKAIEITSDLAKGLSAMNVVLRKTVSKKGFESHYIDMVLDKQFLKPSLQISPSRFTNIILTLSSKGQLKTKDEHGRNLEKFVIPVFYRYVKGPNTNGEYKCLEMIFTKGLSERYFFNDFDELANLNILESNGSLKIDWQYQPEKFDATLTLNPVFE